MRGVLPLEHMPCLQNISGTIPSISGSRFSSGRCERWQPGILESPCQQTHTLVSLWWHCLFWGGGACSILRPEVFLLRSLPSLLWTEHFFHFNKIPKYTFLYIVHPLMVVFVFFSPPGSKEYYSRLSSSPNSHSEDKSHVQKGSLWSESQIGVWPLALDGERDVGRKENGGWSQGLILEPDNWNVP